MTSDNERDAARLVQEWADGRKDDFLHSIEDFSPALGDAIYALILPALQRDDSVVEEMVKHAEGLLEFVINKYNVKDADGFTCPHHRALYIAISKFNASRGKK